LSTFKLRRTISRKLKLKLIVAVLI
jgi:hypothetical protein